MQEQNEEVISHLRQALLHLDHALQSTTAAIVNNPQAKKTLAKIWEDFLGTFFGKVRSKGKESNINLLGLISFPKLRKFG
ncbi:hypothetical protein [Bacillus sp. FJAT-42315]|uniref:hypothetical protein n=1 Tax=Bacillus sp. FJAT-42315 TaxID=2014077 RepID=UPI000C24F5C8|nr:hypothetical protein [Bacillus sp. FJAT-42315]